MERKYGDDFDLAFDAAGSSSGGVPLAGDMAQSDTGKSTGPSSATGGDKSVGAKNDGAAMKSTSPGYEDKSDAAGAVGKSPGNAAATGQSGKKPAQ